MFPKPLAVIPLPQATQAKIAVPPVSPTRQRFGSTVPSGASSWSNSALDRTAEVGALGEAMVGIDRFYARAPANMPQAP
jgi:hypothetical protein